MDNKLNVVQNRAASNANPEQLSPPREMNCSRGNSDQYRMCATVVRHLAENRWPFRLHATYNETITARS
jgi:hypothetical protein